MNMQKKIKKKSQLADRGIYQTCPGRMKSQTPDDEQNKTEITYFFR
jgi:hypothetical protein